MLLIMDSAGLYWGGISKHPSSSEMPSTKKKFVLFTKLSFKRMSNYVEARSTVDFSTSAKQCKPN
jgi:hypothetical protein